MKQMTPEAAHAAELARIDRLARLMDSRFSIFGIRFGLDGLLGLVPGVGDLLTAAPSAWIIWKAHELGLGRRTLIRMGVNTGLDLVVGSVPLVGDIFDIGFKGNLRNVRLIHDELSKRGPSPLKGARHEKTPVLAPGGRRSKGPHRTPKARR